MNHLASDPHRRHGNGSAPSGKDVNPMNRRILVPIAVVAVAAVVAGAWWLRRPAPAFWTGFVEGEERVLKSEVAGRVLEVRFSEGETVPPDSVVALLDDSDARARLEAQARRIDVLAAQIRTQEERVRLSRETLDTGVGARQADLRAAVADAELTAKNLAREQELVKTGASTVQLLDDARMRQVQARSRLEQAREMLAQAESEGRTVEITRRALEALTEERKLAEAQRAELEVARSKFTIHSPAVETRVQSKLLWPGELAQPGTPILSVLDPHDTYVQVWVPVTDAALLEVGRQVEVELDGEPGKRFPAEVSFVADRASFTPEKIETRRDRLGQVYRVKVKLTSAADVLRPGTEGNVYLAPGDRPREQRRAEGAKAAEGKKR